MKLLTYLSDVGNRLPQPADARLLALGFEAWDEALAAAPDDPEARAARNWSAAPRGRRLLAAIFGNSPFLGGLAVKEWRFLSRLVAEGADPLFDEIAAEVERPDDPDEDAPGLMRRLRIAKRRTALLAAAAELAGAWSLEQQMAALSRFAAAAVGAALRHLLRQAAAKDMLALPDPADPERHSGLIVLGLGKLGGAELNYSSDIDLILFFDPAKARVTAREGAQPFFSRLARDLVRLLEERTGDGYVFRTDLRLRPDPASTPAAMSVAAAMAYYESVGQNWERAALIKARPIAGDRIAGRRLLRELRPFLWRKHLDFAAIQDIHSIKRQINAFRGGGRIAVEGHDIKIGRGGIREIEFFAQTQQLIWGGRLPQLRVRATCEALRRLAACRRVDPATAATLIDDYRFLRRVEHRLQMVDDQQTHHLPSDRDGIERLATFLGYAARGCLCRRSDRASELGRAPLRRAVRAGAEPGAARQPRLYRQRGRSRHPAHARWARLCRPGRGRRASAQLASWADARHSQPAGARDPDRAGARIAARLRRHRASRRGAAALRPVSVASAGGRAAVLAVSGEPRIAGAGRRCHGRGAASGRAAGAAPGIARRGADRGIFRAGRPTAPGSPPSLPMCSPPPPILPTRSTCCGAGPASGASRSGCSCCAARSTARKPARRWPTSPRPRSPHSCPRSRPSSRSGMGGSRAARSRSSAWAGSAAAR